MTTDFTNAQMSDLIDFRHALHRKPELSGEEHNTAHVVAERLKALQPDALVTGLGKWTEENGDILGGTGIAAVFESGKDGPTLLFRCELDGLPIEELSTLAYRSVVKTKAHLCGHDGHMAILLGLAMRLSLQRPAMGRVIILFQPAEETGKGARAVLADPAFAPLMPNYAFALHNLPGVPLGTVQLKADAMCCASRGVRIKMEGKTSHASMPQDGKSPVEALMKMVDGLNALSNGLDAEQELDEAYKLVTITHIRVGEPCFGVSPGTGELWATLRTVTDAAMNELLGAVQDLAKAEAAQQGLAMRMDEDDVFDACTNHTMTTEMVAKALEAEGIAWAPQPDPMRFSEDFGQFGQHCPATLFLLGSGLDQPQLHNPDFDFPDSLIGIGAGIFERIIREQLG
ncbi:amidohydrolase [Cohaesibacter celericrescens]|uniref:Amidohydrolase n=1 Tax=Cohaesibacter celericrescens TaxID=2067669 RepID=A0A2N5XKQ0_9HYPH|nr:amidohydrolase [Cohaesibacter celericrescens]PLW75093.1 amidohydrolase [Cohaesibacter celericrescens]